MRFASKLWIAGIALALCGSASGQQKINAATGINYPPITGAGTPAAACTSTNYGQPYLNTAVTPNTYYTCGNDGWVIRSGPPGPPGPGGGATSKGPAGTPQASDGNGDLEQQTALGIQPIIAAQTPQSGTWNYGDSTVAGTGPSTGNYVFGAQLRADVPGTWENHGSSGAFTEQIDQLAWSTWNVTSQVPNLLVTYQGGINDAASGVLDNTGGLNNATMSTVGGAAHTVIPLSSQIISSLATASGSWTAVSNQNLTVNSAMGGTFQQSSTNGNTITYTLPAAAKLMYWWPVSDTSTGKFTVSVNGTNQTNFCTGTTEFDSFGCNGQNIIIGGGVSIFGQVLTGNASGTNTIVVTVTSTTGGTNIVMDGAAAAIPALSAHPALVAIQGVQKQQNDDDSQATADFNTAVHTAQQLLTAGGLTNVFFVDVRNGYATARPTNTTTDYVSTTCPGGIPPLHFNDCGYHALAKLFEASASAAGWPVFIPNVGTNGTVGGPVISVGLDLPGQPDFRDDWKIGTSGRTSELRMPGLIYGPGSSNFNLNTAFAARIAFEQAPAQFNGFANKIQSQNAPLAICGVTGAIDDPSTDICNTGIYPDHAYTTLTWHFGPTAGWNEVPTVGHTLNVAYDSMNTVSGSTPQEDQSMVVYIQSGVQTIALPSCNAINDDPANWIQFYVKDSTDTGAITFVASSATVPVAYQDLVNGQTSVSFSNVPRYTKFELQCSQSTSPSTKITLTEQLPSVTSLHTATRTLLSTDYQNTASIASGTCQQTYVSGLAAGANPIFTGISVNTTTVVTGILVGDHVNATEFATVAMQESGIPTSLTYITICNFSGSAWDPTDGGTGTSVVLSATSIY